MKRKKSLIIDGSKFPLPRRISDKFFREESYPKLVVNVNEDTGEIKKSLLRQDRRSALSVMVSSYARSKYLEDFARKLREDSEKLSNVLDYERIKKILDDESSSLQDRVASAKNII